MINTPITAAPPVRRPAPWAPRAAIAALLGVLLGSGATIAVLGRHDRSAPVTAVQAQPDSRALLGAAAGVGPAILADRCRDALHSADIALKAASKLDAELAEHTDVTNRLLSGALSPQQAEAAGIPLLIDGTRSATDLHRAYADYRTAEGQCHLP